MFGASNECDDVRINNPSVLRLEVRVRGQNGEEEKWRDGRGGRDGRGMGVMKWRDRREVEEWERDRGMRERLGEKGEW